MKHRYSIETFPDGLSSYTPASRLACLLELYMPPVYDDDGKLIGFAAEGEGFITREQLWTLLDSPGVT